MNQRATTISAATLLALCWPAILTGQQIETYFSPRGGCTAATVTAIDAATTSIDAAAYQLTSDPIAAALTRAHKRGVMVRVVTDRAQEAIADTTPRAIRASGIQFRTDAACKLQHNKYTVIDGCAVLTGSFNWSDNAEHHNAENLIIIHDPKTAAAFAANFAKHWLHARPFVYRPPARRTDSPPRATSPPPQTRPRSKGF